MSIQETFCLSLKNIWGSKTRTFLTMLGIIIGVTAVIVIVGLGNGMQKYMADSFSSMGTNTLTVQIMGRGSSRSVSEEEMYAVAEENPALLEAVSPTVSMSGTVKADTETLDSTKVSGVSEEYPTNDMTLEDYDALARKMTSGSGSGKVYGAHYHTWRSAVSLFGILDGKNTIIDGTYDFLKPVYEMVLAQQADGIVMDYGELKTANLHYSAAFQNGTAAMVNMGSWFLATMQQYNANAAAEGYEPVDFGMVKYPHPAGVPAGSTLGTVTSLGVNANSENKELANDFVNWCAGPEGAAIMASTGSFPAVSTAETVNTIASTEGFPSDAESKEALNTAAIYLEMPLSDKASEIETVLNTEHDAIMTGAETVDEGIANMNEQVQAILNG